MAFNSLTPSRRCGCNFKCRIQMLGIDWYFEQISCEIINATVESDPANDKLTLNVLGLCYLGLTSSISWLLMPWWCKEPGHHQPWYWLCHVEYVYKSLSYLAKDFKYLCHECGGMTQNVNVYVPSEKALKDLKLVQGMPWCHRHQAFTWTDVDHLVWSHMLPQGHNELILKWFLKWQGYNQQDRLIISFYSDGELN